MINPDPMSTPSRVQGLGQAFFLPNEKAAADYMPLVGRVLVNICTLPAAITGAITGVVHIMRLGLNFF